MTDLWKKYEYLQPETKASSENGHETKQTENCGSLPAQADESQSIDESQSFLEAFEAEMAKIMVSSESAEEPVRQDESPSAEAQPQASNSDRLPNPGDIFASTMQNFLNGAGLIRSELESKLPELDQRLQDAQKTVPEHVATTLQTALASIDSQTRNLSSALGNASANLERRFEQGTQANGPTCERPVDGFRTMASELGQMGRTLFEAFGSEFRRNMPTDAENDSNASSREREEQSNANDQHPTGTSVPNTQGPQSSSEDAAESEAPSWRFRDTPAWLLHPNHSAPSPSVTSRACQTRSPSGDLHGSCIPSYRNHGRHNQAAPAEPTSQPSREATGAQPGRSANETLFIGNVGFRVTEKTVKDVFASKGFLVNVKLPIDLATEKHAGFGYLQFPSFHAAKAALEALQGAHIDGHAINLEFSDSPSISSVQPAQNTTNPASPVVSNNQAITSQSGNESGRLATSKSPPRADLLQRVQAMEVELGGREASDGNAGLNQRRNAGSSSVSTTESNKNKSATILDEGGDDFEFSARYPSLVPETDRSEPKNNATPGKLPHISPELEMKRFPPVSQFEAHLLAEKRGVPPTSSSNTPMRESQPVTETSGNKELKPDNAGVQSIPGAPPRASFLQRFEDAKSRARRTDAPSEGSRVSEQTLQPGGKYTGDQLRRSRTITPLNSAATLSGPFDAFAPYEPRDSAESLRRGATERHASRASAYANRGSASGSQASGNRDVSDNIVRRSKSLFAGNPCHQVNMPAPSTPSAGPVRVADADPKRRAALDYCVKTLLSLGYGSPTSGEHQRIGVYAAAADGKVSDAIDMIEEERKAYERRSRQN